MRILVFLSILLSSCSVSHRFIFEDEPRGIEPAAHGFAVLYEVDGDSVQTRHGAYHLVFPDEFHANDTSFATEYFTGHPGEVENGVGLLIANRKTGWPKIFVDLNNNLDFSDDAGEIEFSREDSTAIITLHRKDNPAATFSVNYILPELSATDVASYNDLFDHEGYVKAGIPMMSARYCFFSRRLNNRIKLTSLQGESIKIALCDFNCNGYYNDVDEDRIFASITQVEYTPWKPSGAFPLLNDSTLFAFQEQVYEVVEVDSLGRSLKIKKSKLAFDPPAAPGQKMPDYSFKLLNGRDTSFSAFFNDGKYLLIDAWGSWCKGCHSSARDLSELYTNFNPQLEVIGLNTGEPHENIVAFVEKYEHPWTQGLLTPEIRDELLIDAYPTYILVDPEGRIVSLFTDPKKVKKILTENFQVRN